MFVSYVERCTDCACSSLLEPGGRVPLPGAAGCGRCRCHRTASRARAVSAAWAGDAARARQRRRLRDPRADQPAADLVGPVPGS